jgi:hypothetical protein
MTKYVLMSRYQEAGQSRAIRIVNRSFEDVAMFIIFGNNTNRSKLLAQRDKSRLNSGNAC